MCQHRLVSNRRLVLVVATALALPGCTADPQPTARSLVAPGAPSPTPATVDHPLGLLQGPLDFPAAHFQGRNGWRAVVKGVPVILVAGQVFLDQPDGRSVPYGALYTELDGGLDPASHPELQYRFTDQQPRGGYRVVGGTGPEVRVVRDDGQAFVYDLRTGQLT